MAVPTSVDRRGRTKGIPLVITVFGSINLDLIGGVERLPRPGETVPGSAICHRARRQGREPGARRGAAGAAVRMVGAVGKDEFAEPALALLAPAASISRGCARRRADRRGADPGRCERRERHRRHSRRERHGRRGRRRSARLRAGDALLLQLESAGRRRSRRRRGARAAGAHVLLNFAPFRGDALGADRARDASHRERERVRADRGGARHRRRAIEAQARRSPRRSQRRSS